MRNTLKKQSSTYFKRQERMLKPTRLLVYPIILLPLSTIHITTYLFANFSRPHLSGFAGGLPGARGAAGGGGGGGGGGGAYEGVKDLGSVG
jgi:hypothetical protein